MVEMSPLEVEALDDAMGVVCRVPLAATPAEVNLALERIALAGRLEALRALALAGEGGGQWRARVIGRYEQLLRKAEAEWERSR